MKIANIKKLKNKAIKEAQKEVDKIFLKYSRLINEDIASQIPIGQEFCSWNGMNAIFKDGEQISRGNAWSITSDPNPKLDFLATLQYILDKDEFSASFSLDEAIKGTKP